MAEPAQLRTRMTDPFDEQLVRMRAHYRQQAVEQVEAIAHALAQLRLHFSLGALRVIEWESHRLAGSAGSFGYHRLGEAAAAIDDLVFDLLVRDEAPGEAVLAELVQMLAELQAAAADLAPSR